MKASLPLLAVLSSTAVAAAPTTAPASVYRFDVSIAGIDASPATYTLLLAENIRGELHSGPNISYFGGSPAGSIRKELGMDLKLRYAEHNGVLLVDGEFRMSAIANPSAPNPNWTQVDVGDVVVPLTPGKATLFTSVYDLAAHKRYEVTLTAQRVL
jgi:hypothetical protein